MLPCMALYSFIGTAINITAPPDHNHPFREWILTYASTDFAKAATDVANLLDFLLASSSSSLNLNRDFQHTTTLNQLRQLYKSAMQLEYNFFDAQSYETSHEHLSKIETMRTRIDQAALSGQLASILPNNEIYRTVLIDIDSIKEEECHLQEKNLESK